MNWVWFAIGAHFLWALVNTGEKYLVSSRIKNPLAYLCLATWLNVLIIPIAWVVKVQIPNWEALGYIFAVAVFYFLGTIFYIISLQREEVSRINILWQIIPIFNLTFAYILFRETLSAGQLAAFTFLLSGGILASLHLGGGKWRWSKALGTMLVACLFYSGYALTFDRLSIFFDPLSTWFWSGILVMAMSPLFLLNGRIRNDFQTMIKGLGRTAWLTIFGINFLDSGATLLNMLALALGPVALVYSLEGTQIIFVFLMTIFLTLRAPKILKEQLNKENLWLKIVALIFMVVGTVMIYYNK